MVDSIDTEISELDTFWFSFLWEYIKDIVYATVPENKDLQHKITIAVESITAEMLQSVIKNIINVMSNISNVSNMMVKISSN